MRLKTSLGVGANMVEDWVDEVHTIQLQLAQLMPELFFYLVDQKQENRI